MTERFDMTLARKLALALVVGISAVMAADAYVRVQREVAIFENDQARDEWSEARLLASVVGSVWRAGGSERARQLIEDAQGIDEPRLRWLWLDELAVAAGERPAPSRARMPAAPRQSHAAAATLSGEDVRTLADGREVARVGGNGGDARRSLYVPLVLEGERPAVLELSETLSPPPSYVRGRIRDNVVAMAIVLALCGTFAVGLGYWFVGRPMRALCATARRVGEGDFTGRLALRQRDEVGALAREIDAMCERLAEATRRAATEAEARIATLEQLRHADRVKTVGQLASGVAHELGTPLNVISGRARLIMGGDLRPDELATGTRTILEQTERMAAIIRQLLRFSRRRQPRVERTDAGCLAARVLEMLAPLAQQRGIATDLEVAPGGAPIEVDEDQIVQALTNVVMNGMQAMDCGGRLTVRVDRPYTSPPSDRGGPQGAYVCVHVEDEGGGIAAADLPHIFEPFFTTKGVGEGTGLGLSIADGIMRDHGGWIAAESTSERGSRFSLFFPPAAGVAHAGPEVSPLAAGGFGGRA